MYIRLKLSALVASCKSEERLRQATGLYSRTLSHFLYPGWDASPSQGFAGTHLVRVKNLAQNTTQWPWPGLEPGPLDPETSALTMRSPRPHNFLIRDKIKIGRQVLVHPGERSHLHDKKPKKIYNTDNIPIEDDLTRSHIPHLDCVIF